MAETVKFTEARVAAIRARVKSGRVEFQDEELPALRLRVSPTSAAWSVLKRIPGGPMSRVLIGKADDVAAGEARKLARIRDRKSVVEGKRVSVRGGLGWRRFI